MNGNIKFRFALLIVFGLFVSTMIFGQTLIHLDGAIKLGNFTDPNPELGILRWSGSDFEVWNGVYWASLTGNREVGTVTDIDGNVYKTIRIGSQVWMTENLRVAKYNDGSIIDQITNSITWGRLTSGAWCWYLNDGNNDEPYGKLYNWFAVNTGKLCPIGWKVPTNTEWTLLTNHLDPTEYDGFQGSVAGGSMKEVGTGLWRSPNSGATNSSGFTARPGGRREPTQSSESPSLFEEIGRKGEWWSRTEAEGLFGDFRDAYNQDLDHDNDRIYRYSTRDKKYGLSVRCIKE